MYCTECGKPTPDNSKFCRYCGAPILTHDDENIAMLQTNRSGGANIDSNGTIEIGHDVVGRDKIEVNATPTWSNTVSFCIRCGRGLNVAKGDLAFRCVSCGDEPICADCFDTVHKACKRCSRAELRELREKAKIIEGQVVSLRKRDKDLRTQLSRVKVIFIPLAVLYLLAFVVGIQDRTIQDVAIVSFALLVFLGGLLALGYVKNTHELTQVNEKIKNEQHDLDYVLAQIAKQEQNPEES